MNFAVFPLVIMLIASSACASMFHTLAFTAPTPHTEYSNVDATQRDLLCKQKLDVADGFSSSDLPRSFVLANQTDDISPSEILELQNSCAGEPILEYTLTLSCDNQSYDVVPLCTITPIQPNGTTIALVGNDPEDGAFMWLQEYSGVFPSLSATEALEVLDSSGYIAQKDSRLVFFDSETYWMFDVTVGEGMTNVFVSFSDREIKPVADILSRLVALESDDSCTGKLPSRCDWMVGKVPYFMQGTLEWCGIFSQKQVLSWYNIQISEYTIANYLDVGPDEGVTVMQLDDSFVHFMGQGNEDKLHHSYGSSNIETEKACLYINCPQIEAIRAPGTGSGDYINHFVTLVGWDDVLGGGSWCLHDTAPCIKDENGYGYDVWCSYNTFDTYWDKRWLGLYTHGSVGAHPIYNEKHPAPWVGISDYGHNREADQPLQDITEFQTLTLGVWLRNTEAAQENARSGSMNLQGVFVRLGGAEIVSVQVGDQLGDFKWYYTYAEDGTAIGDGDSGGSEGTVAGAHIIELYTDVFANAGWPHTVGALVTIRPIFAGPPLPSSLNWQITVHYRGWLADRDEMVREDWVTIDDDRPGQLSTPLPQPRIVRTPIDSYYNTRDNFLDYPTYSKTCQVTDDDSTGPLFSQLPLEYVKASGANRLRVTVFDPSGVSKVQFKYRFWDDVYSGWLNATWNGGSGSNCTYYYDIPQEVWQPHAGSRGLVYWQVYAEDADNDHLWDWASSYSTEYINALQAHSTDVNNDGVTNMRDIGILINAFNSRPGNPKWNSNYDINGDGVINMRDISMAILNFGKYET